MYITEFTFINSYIIQVMARIKNGILGGFSGKVGPVVGVVQGDRSFIRSRPKERTNSTEDEIINRTKFQSVQACLKPLTDFLRVGLKGYGTRTGGYRAAVSHTRKHAIVTDDGGFYIDPALLQVSGGELPMAIAPTVGFIGEDLMEFKWDIQDIPYQYAADQVMLLVYDMAEGNVMNRIYDGAFRSVGRDTIAIIRPFKGKEVEVYLGFLAADRSMQSRSQYLGKIKLPG